MDLALPSSSSSSVPCKYDVFISFRGTDTRNNFISHLYDSLCRKKIQVYKDDISLPRGEEISPSLLKAIEDSKISIVVLSENYATSSWCLEELVHILKCKRERGQAALPVFYGIDPSHVRRQTGRYEVAFVDHEKHFEGEIRKVNDWRSALEEAGNLSGWDSREKRPESVLVEEIAQVVLLKLYNMTSAFGDELDRKFVGMEARLKKIESLLCVDSPDVRVIGIWGLGGIGKSTLAEVTKERFSSGFDSCFSIDVSDGVKRLRRSKVFLVLDNVDDAEQLENLIGDCDETKGRFGEGSRIIVTSRDKKLLMESTDDIYEVEALDLVEATKLFYQNAFKRDSSKIIDYIELSKRVVYYAGGNPLALKVLGSHLRSRSVKEWESSLSELEKAPNEKVYKVLKISYDALDRVKQSIFLDIACFLKGEDRKLFEEILGDHSHIGINVLIEKSLVTFSQGRLSMHDLVQEMAWEIVRQESKQLRKRTRLWVAEDVYSVLRINQGSSRTEGISLDLSQMSRELSLSSRVFEDMENLRFLKIYNWHHDKRQRIYLHQGLQCFPDSLRYLRWSGYPLRSLPQKFEQQNLVKLDMSESNLEKLWSGVEHLENLKHLTLTSSINLCELPDLSHTPKLEYLNLSLCPSLRRFPKISGNNLKYLSMYNSSIEEFHSSFESLGNLQRHITLELGIVPVFPFSFGYSSQAHCFPSLLLVLHSLIHLDLGYWCISQIPDHIGVFASMESLNLCGNDFKNIPSSIKHMSKLKSLDIQNCNRLESLPDLPTSIQSLNVARCVSLEKISTRGCALLTWIEASGCMSLMEIDTDERGGSSWRELLTASREAIARDGNNNRTCVFTFFHCSNLEQSARDNILTLFQREIFGLATSVHPDFESTSAWKIASARYPGDGIPRWFTNQTEGSSVNVTLDRCQVTNFMGYAASVVIALLLDNMARMHSTIGFVSCRLHFKTSRGSLHECHGMRCSLEFPYGIEGKFERYVFMWCLNSGPAFDVEAALGLEDKAVEALFDFELENEAVPLDEGMFKIEKCGIHMISLREAEEFGFSVEACKASLRWCRKTTPSLFDLSYLGEQRSSCLDLDI